MSSDIDLTQPQIDLRDRILLSELSFDDEKSAAAIDVEQAVFLERFGNTPEEFAREYGGLVSRSGLGVARRGQDVLAVARFSWAEAGQSLKTLRDSTNFDADVDAFLEQVGGVEQLLDVLTISAVDHSPGHDGRSLGGTLTQAMCFLAARARRKTHVVAVLDDVILRYLIDDFGAPFEPLPGAKSRPYLGSGSSVPVSCSVDEFALQVFGDLRKISNGESLEVGVDVHQSLVGVPDPGRSNTAQ